MASIVVKTVRHQCPHCRRTWAKRLAAEAHIARCWRNPDVLGCKTCSLLTPPEDGPYPEHPGWGEECDAEIDLRSGLRTGCPSWQPDGGDA